MAKRSFRPSPNTGGSLSQRFPPGLRVRVSWPSNAARFHPSRFGRVAPYVGKVGVVEKVFAAEDGFLRVKVRFDADGLPPFYAGATAKYLQPVPATEADVGTPEVPAS